MTRLPSRFAVGVLVFVGAYAPAAPSAAQEPRGQEGPSVTLPSSTAKEVDRTAHNTVFFELGGPGILYSANYDRMFGELFSLRVGATYFKFHELYDDNASFFFAPIVANVLLGSPTHKFEAGLGVVPGWAFPNGSGDYSGFQFNGVAVAGYRYAPLASGFAFRANLELLRLRAGFLPWVGVSAGYSF